MCKMKSAIILKDRVFIPNYDSHSDMLEELKIADTQANAERLFIRAELSPSDGDVFSNIDTWVFKVDQDIRPDWFVEEVDKARMVEVVKAWAKDHIHIGVDGLKIDGGENHYIKDCKGVIISNSTVTAYGNSTVKAYGNSTVTAYGNSTVKACDNSTVTACDNSTVTACDNSTVVKTEFSIFDKAHLTLSENATFKDCKAKIIYQSGDWELRLVGKDGKIES